MHLHRFHVSEAIGSKKVILIESAELLHQITKVLRLRKGDKAVLFDGSGSDYECEVAGFGGVGKSDQKVVSFRVVSATHSRYMPSRKIYLCAAVIKKDNFEFIVEKATELGVTDIIPVIAERSEKKALNEERLKKIAIEASEQSGRGDLLVIHQIAKPDDAVASLIKEKYQLIAFHTEGNRFDPNDIENNSPIAIFIGPEGGWTPSEIEVFHKNKVAVRCLGPQVLRAETAVVAALSQVVFRS